MERVQYYQEQMLPELKEFVKKKIFTSLEVKEIVKKRTAFEMALVRRVADKADFLRYAAYEMGLEALRKKRIQRLKLPPVGPSISDYALVRRQYHIFERATRKFKADVGLWTQYIDIARRNGARALVSRISARALQLHPTNPSLYILVSQHELSQHSPAAARSLLQRGLRLNGDSIELWTEYVKMELGFVEQIRRRWDVLGIGKGGGEDTEGAEGVTGSGQEARKEVMNGAIVRAVIDSAVKALPILPLFTSLSQLLSTYPSSLAPSLLSHLSAHLLEALPDDPRAVLLYATRSLSGSISGPELVDKLKDANDELSAAVKTLGSRMAVVYAEWVNEWTHRLEDEERSLVHYLVLTFHSLATTARRSQVEAAFCLVHIDLASRYGPELGSAKSLDALKLARKYTARFPADAALWLARIRVEEEDDREVVVREAREKCKDVRLWEWGLDRFDAEHQDESTLRSFYEPLLSESLAFPEIYAQLLLRYLTLLPRPSIISTLGRHQPHADLYSPLFAQLSRLAIPSAHQPLNSDGAPSSEPAMRDPHVPIRDLRPVLSVLYDRWRTVPGQEGAAALAWAEWLLRSGDGGEAVKVIARATGVEGVREAWRDILSQLECQEEDTEGQEMGMDADERTAENVVMDSY